jgi:hypothetical protein
MKALLCPLACCLGMLSLADAHGFPVESKVSEHLGKTYVTEVTPSDLKDSPAWDSDKSPPPLAPEKAGELARVCIETSIGPSSMYRPGFPQNATWQVGDLTLKRYRGTSIWYYVVLMEPIYYGRTGPSPKVAVIVTMDGKAISPRHDETRKARREF